MTYNYVTVVGKYDDGAGTANTGRVEWYPSDNPTDTDTGEDVDVEPIVQILDDTGSYSVSLLACDNSTLTPFGWTFTSYVPHEEFGPVTYIVNHADGATQERTSLNVYDDPPVL